MTDPSDWYSCLHYFTFTFNKGTMYGIFIYIQLIDYGIGKYTVRPLDPMRIQFSDLKSAAFCFQVMMACAKAGKWWMT